MSNNEPAFPQKEPLNSDHQGMSLRDYFIAHAPADPQRWFQPVMKGVMPVYPVKPGDFTAEEKHEIEGWREDMYRVCDLKCPRARAYAEAFDLAASEMAAWCSEVDKQRHIQWPAAWADEMLKARQS